MGLSISSFSLAQEAEQITSLEPVIVEGQKDPTNSNINALESLRFTNNSNNTPITSQVIPTNTIENLQANTFEDILEYTAGITPANSFGGTIDSFRIRGFGGTIAENGIVTSGGGTRRVGKRNAAAIQSVEILRGPQGALFGAGGFGGVVNIVTKKPKPDDFFRTRSTFSTEGLLRQNFDLNTSHGENDKYQFRFITSLEEDEREFRDRADGDSRFLKGMFRYHPHNDFSFIFGAEHTDSNIFFDRGVPIDLNGNLLGPRHLNLSPFAIGNTSIRRTAFDAQVKYNFSDNWSLNHITRYETNRLNGVSISQIGVFQTPVPLRGIAPAFRNLVLRPFRDITRTAIMRDLDNDLFTTRTDIKGSFDTGSLSHDSLISFEYSYTDSYTNSISAGAQAAIRLRVDLQNPIIDSPIPPFRNGDTINDTIETFGISLFDNITVNDSLNILLGGRYSHVDTKVRRQSIGTIADFSEIAFSPTLGVNYNLNEQFSIYGLYAESFLVNSPDTNGNALDPREGKSIEFGLRYHIPNTGLTANTSLFDIRETNRPSRDPSVPNANQTAGTFESQGFDFTLQGKVNDRLSLILNYVYNDTEFTKTANALALGSPGRGIPKNQASLFASYDFTPSEIKGLSIHAGIIYVGERLNSVPTLLLQQFPSGGSTLQDYIRVDVGARYQFGRHKSIGLRVENLFEEEYERQSANAGTALPQAPRTFFATLNWEF